MGHEVSARDLVKQVWDEVAAERAQRPTPMAGLGDYDRLEQDAERQYLNSHYVLARAAPEGAGRLRLVRGNLRARAARFVIGVLEGYFDDEQEFLAHLVRLQNTVTTHVDRLSEEVRRLEELLQAESERLRTADAALHGRLEERVRALEQEVARLHRPEAGEP